VLTKPVVSSKTALERHTNRDRDREKEKKNKSCCRGLVFAMRLHTSTKLAVEVGYSCPGTWGRKLRRRRRQTFWNVSLAAFLSVRGFRVGCSGVCATFGDRRVSFLSGCFCKGVRSCRLHVEF
jgi:hypothetical protein